MATRSAVQLVSLPWWMLPDVPAPLAPTSKQRLPRGKSRENLENRGCSPGYPKLMASTFTAEGSLSAEKPLSPIEAALCV